MSPHGPWCLGLCLMENETDGSLFEFLQFFDTDPTEANAALRELMRRYEAILSRRCERFCTRYPALGYSGADLAQDTFWKAVQRAETYRPLENADAKPAECQKYTLAWLFKIAQRRLFDVARHADRPAPFEKNASDPEPMGDDELAAALVRRYQDRFEVSDAPAVSVAFEQLDERSRLVLLWTIDMRSRTPGGEQMMRGSLTTLADRLCTTPDNLRQIRKRAIDTLSRAIKSSRQRVGERR